jgi:peptide-methionine (R)-S-oxide reductase
MFEETLPDFTRNAEATGTYVCARCGNALFAANKKFEAGCGFPSFWMHLNAGVELKPLDTYGRYRVQLLCKHCRLHLGHLFSNKHTPTGLRYCINSAAIRLQEIP